MTEIAFHFNAPDKFAYSCRLLRKAYGTAAKVVVLGPSAALRRLDDDLWTFSPVDFIAHCNAQAGTVMANASPIYLSESTDDSPHLQVLLNLGDQIPQGFERFERLIQIVGLDDEDRQLARGRWKH